MKFTPPIINDAQPQTIQRAFAKLYDDMNELAKMVAGGVSSETRSNSAGQDSSIRMVRNKANDSYELEGRFEDGWVTLSSVTKEQAGKRAQ